ncbi:MAG: hypothetical protein QNJ31_06330 [Candidatus Caenarcaniphilales bacterium]|nr:hypothetical protein [Candidatus Caenarcaniphilales bacterium]
MNSKAVFYHAGCSVCVSAEQKLLNIINPEINLEIVHLGERKEEIAEAEKIGVKSVPALVMDNTVLHINFGASLNEVKKS